MISPILRILTLFLLVWLLIACVPIHPSPTTSPNLVTGITTPEDTVRQLEAQRSGQPRASITIDALRETRQGPLIFYTVSNRANDRRWDRQFHPFLCVARPHHDSTGWRLHRYEDTWCIRPKETDPPQLISCRLIINRFDQNPMNLRLILFGRRIDPRVVSLDLVGDPPQREVLTNGIFYLPIHWDGGMIQLRDAQNAVIHEGHTNKLCI